MSQICPRWANRLPKKLLIGNIILLNAIVFGVWYFFSPRFLNVGYEPIQPVPYSHAIHAGKLGIDCRYCHTSVERSAHANVPPTQTCMNCHSHVLTKDSRLALVRSSYKTGKPIPWIRVHQLPGYVYFNHSAHINAGIGCQTCHGRIDKMTVVHQVQPLNMDWCLNCHRNPAPYLRPVADVTKMGWKAPGNDPEAYGKKLMIARNIHAPTYCDGCHR